MPETANDTADFAEVVKTTREQIVPLMVDELVTTLSARPNDAVSTRVKLNSSQNIDVAAMYPTRDLVKVFPRFVYLVSMQKKLRKYGKRIGKRHALKYAVFDSGRKLITDRVKISAFSNGQEEAQLILSAKHILQPTKPVLLTLQPTSKDQP